MDKNITEIVDMINDYYATKFELDKISDIENYEVKWTGKSPINKFNPYRNLTVKDFIVIYKIERMYENELIEELDAFKLKRKYLVYLDILNNIANFELNNIMNNKELTKEELERIRFLELRKEELEKDLNEYNLLKENEIIKRRK